MTLAGTTVTLSSGVEVFPETQVYWDDEKNRALRIWVRVWRVKTSGFMRPISESDFIKAPSGEFVSE